MAASADKQNTLSVRDNRTGKTYTVPIYDNAIEATAFKAMRAEPGKSDRKENETESGIRVYDPGFMNTAVLSSTITYINGDKGILRYRGYPIEQLAQQSTYLETAYLLIYGQLPTKMQRTRFEDEVMHHTFVHNDLEKLVASFRYDAHPMAVLASSFAALGAFAPEANPALQGQTLYSSAGKGDLDALAVMDKQIVRLLGKSITLAAMSWRVRQGRPFNHPPKGLNYTETFLYLLDRLSEEDYKPSPVISKALDVLFMLHADHELNCSTAAVLQAGSSLVDPYSAIAAGISALYGPLHGGANEAVIRMLTDIGSPENVPDFVEKVKRREKMLSGFGHRVYKTSDPRSFIVRKVANEVFAVTGKDKLLDTAIALHDIAIKDEYFVSRRLYPNVDFWSGLIYRQLGFPYDMFTVLFAVPRIAGWLAHWRQMMLQKGGVKIWRPRQLYIGSGERKYVDENQRDQEPPADPTVRLNDIPHLFSNRSSLATYRGKM